MKELTLTEVSLLIRTFNKVIKYLEEADTAFLCRIIDRQVFTERYQDKIDFVIDYLESKRPSKEQYSDFIEHETCYLCDSPAPNAWWDMYEIKERIRFINILLAELKEIKKPLFNQYQKDLHKRHKNAG